MIKHNVIFYTDDDLDDLKLFKTAIYSINETFRVSLHENGEQLISALKSRQLQPDILFLDINMPKKNGFEVLLDIQEIPFLQNLPVIVLSSTANYEMVSTAKNLGAKLFVTKPDSPEQLANLLTIILSIDWKNPPKLCSFYFNPPVIDLPAVTV